MMNIPGRFHDFPGEGCVNSLGAEGANLLFGKISRKLYQNEENWTGVGVGASKMYLCRLDPPRLSMLT